ncbi:uncharacterized protein LOC141908707 [Tubulanus polymorphus]|uniref:uncharacterized protein LOC141908707 n=1 Tax=Tubulanus polymorphus TaxID=672921 RepID=UPI003DA40FD9
MPVGITLVEQWNRPYMSQGLDSSGLGRSTGTLSDVPSLPSVSGRRETEESTTDLSELIEDKEIASKAVAFVVNSTRKGIVPLCADIANLLVDRKTLERKLTNLSRENDVLRSQTASLRTSQSTSPTPPTIANYCSSDQSSRTREKGYRPCSRCSQCSSSLHSNSPQFDKMPRASSPNSSIDSLNRQKQRQRQYSTTSTKKHHHRKHSLPDITNDTVATVSPIARTSKEVQCTIIGSDADYKLEEQFRETVRLNARLAEELGACRMEVEILTGRLKELEMNNLARQYTDNRHMENETTISYFDEVNHAILPIIDHSNHHPHSSKKSKSTKKSSKESLPVPGKSVVLIHGCKCANCDGKSVHNDMKFPINEKENVEVGDHVVVRGNRTGFIRYIGHLDKISQPQIIFIGLELDAPVGRHDGCLDGKRYFQCKKEYGVFLTLQDVVCIISKKVSKRPHSFESKKKSSSSDNDSKGRNTKISLKREKSDKSGHSDKKSYKSDAKIEIGESSHSTPYDFVDI